MLGVLYLVWGIWSFRGVLATPAYPLIVGGYESVYIHNLTRQLIASNEIESLAIYKKGGEPQRSPRFLAQSLEQSLMEEFQIPIVTWGLRRNVSLRRILGYNTLVYVVITSVLPSEEPIFDVLSDGLTGQHYVPMLFIYKRPEKMTPTPDDLKIFFAWCWRYRFTNVLLKFQRMIFNNSAGISHFTWHHELFTYTPFPELTLLNWTESGYQRPEILMDLRGYEFKVPFFQDPPHLFQLPNGRLSGVLGLLFDAYVRHRKGRLCPKLVAGVDRYNYQEDLMLAAARGEIEMGVHPYSQMMQPGASKTAGSFPMTATNTCVLVPWQRQPPSEQFLGRVLHINGCIFLMLLLATTLGWQMVCADGRRGFQLSLMAFFQQPLTDRELQRLTSPYKPIHMAMLMAFFVLWSLRTGNLSSVFTWQNPGPQIETAEDFLATPLRLMLTETEMQMYFTAGLLPMSLRPRLLVVNRTTLMEHLDRLNTSYAYCTTAEHWTVIRLQQSRMHRPPFRLAAKLCTALHMLRFPVQWNSPFERNFYKFATQSRQFGFWENWETRGHRDALRMGLVVRLTDDYRPFLSLKLKDLESLFKLYGVSLLGSFGCLLGEMAWNYYRNYRA